MSPIHLQDYWYELPDHKVARFPVSKRDASKLLFYQNEKITDHSFADISSVLPNNANLFFNDTKVIPARLNFQKETGAIIEIFLLQPILPSPIIAQAMEAQNTSTWQCTIGNLKKWKHDVALTKQVEGITLQAKLQDNQKVTFTWNGSSSFAEIISKTGKTPLPPYLNRQAEKSDKERYQTVYSHWEGAVAAPTAGLHFTPHLLEQLSAQGISTDFLTLHVSAGTFQPIKVKEITRHIMHEEQVVVNKNSIEKLQSAEAFPVAIGTTSMRTLESLYWFGTKLLKKGVKTFEISQEEPYAYDTKDLPSREEAFQAVTGYMDQEGLQHLTGKTSIYIYPGYRFQVVKGLITNFHQPGSTLILLIAAFVGPDWKKIYEHALEQSYRFLSYGDSSLLIPNEQ